MVVAVVASWGGLAVGGSVAVGAGVVVGGGDAVLIEADPAVRVVTLRSGLVVVTKELGAGHPDAGRVAVALHVPVGTLGCGEGEMGVARVAAKLATVGSASVPPGELARRLEPAGIRPEQALTHRVTYDATVLSAVVDGGEMGAAGELARYLVGLLGGHAAGGEVGPWVDDGAVEAARRAVVRELLDEGSASTRISAAVLPELDPGSRLGVAYPRSARWMSERVTAGMVRAFAREHWRARGAAVAIVGGASHEELLGLLDGVGVEGMVEGGEAGVEGDGVVFSPRGVAVGREAGFGATLVQAMWASPRVVVRSVRDVERSVAEEVAAEVVGARLSRAAGGESSVFSGASLTPALTRGLEMPSLVAAASAESWEAAVRVVVSAAASVGAGVGGGAVSEAEVRAAAGRVANRAAMARARRSIGGEAARLLMARARGEVLADEGELARLRAEAAMRIGVGEVREALWRYGVEGMAVAVLGPGEGAGSGDGEGLVPSVAEVERVVREAVGSPMEMGGEEALAGLADVIGVGVEGVSPEVIGVSSPVEGAVTAVFGNGVEFAVKPMRDGERPGRVTVAAWVGAGPMTEGEGTVGASTLMHFWGTKPAVEGPVGGWGDDGGGWAGAFERDAASATQAWARGAGVVLRLEARPDTVVFVADAPAHRAESALGLMSAMLSRPVLDEGRLSSWLGSLPASIDAARTDGDVARQIGLYTVLAVEGDVRAAEAVPSEVPGVDAARGWLRGALVDSPLRLSMAGPVDVESALGMASRTVGLMPGRASVSGDVFAGRGLSTPRPSSGYLKMSSPLAEPRASVGLVYGIEAPRDAVLAGRLEVGARVLERRLRERLGERLDLASESEVEVMLSDGPLAIPRLEVRLSSESGTAEAAWRLAEAELQRLSLIPADERELERAKRAVERGAVREAQSTEEVAVRLALGGVFEQEGLAWRGRWLDAARAASGAEVSAALRGVVRADRRTVVTVVPE